jgi:hypothetical protein
MTVKLVSDFYELCNKGHKWKDDVHCIVCNKVGSCCFSYYDTRYQCDNICSKCSGYCNVCKKIKCKKKLTKCIDCYKDICSNRYSLHIKCGNCIILDRQNHRYLYKFFLHKNIPLILDVTDIICGYIYNILE